MKLYQGIDICSVQRIQEVISRQKSKFLKRVFSMREQKYCSTKKRLFEHYAARFATKEALIKAWPLIAEKGIPFSSLEVRHHATGKPYMSLAPSVRRRIRLPAKARIEISLTHEREWAIATVLILVP